MYIFCISTCSAQLSMFPMERRPRNTLIINIITINLSLSAAREKFCQELIVPELCIVEEWPALQKVMHLFSKLSQE